MKTRVYAICTGVFVLLVICWASANTALRVDESATRMELRGAGHVILLPIENPNPAGVTVTARIDLLDPQDRIRATASKSVTLKPGRNTVELPLELRFGQLPQPAGLLWYRLRYHVTADGAPWEGGAQGLLAIGQISPDIFELHAFGPRYTRSDPYLVRVRAIHPVTRVPVAGVKVDGLLGDEDEEQPAAPQRVKAVTNAQGYATLAFRIPAMNAEDEEDSLSEMDWKVHGRRGDFEDSVSGTTQIDHTGNVLLLTDKPLYQPGQKLRIRLLALDTTRRPLAGKTFSIKLDDPEGTTVFRDKVTTSKFGVAHLEWDTPESLRLGDYALHVEGEGGNDAVRAYRRVKISRYDLPNFSVAVRPDHEFYLPGQDARVEVRANYLFGKPVARGAVRVAMESDRQWDYAKQKWIVTDEESYTGDLGPEGAFSAKLPLEPHHSDLEDNENQRFRDLNYAAYVTDASTGRTEQRRFSLRITKDRIHLYIIGGDDVYNGMPAGFYVSASHADGRPAACNVEIRALLAQFDEFRQKREELSGPLAVVRTNRYGVARVPALNVSGLEDHAPSELILRAWDERGATGRQSHNLWWQNRPGLRVETNKSLYAPGEPVEVQLRGNFADTSVIVDAMSKEGHATSQTVRLRHGRAFLVFPPHERFRGEVQITAYALGLPASEGWREKTAFASRSVLFPAPQDLSVTLRTERAEYRPGETARVNVAVHSPAGMGGQNALGVVVFDKAVEERANSDGLAGVGSAAPGFRESIQNFLGNDSQIAGIHRPDLDRLNTSEPLPAGLDLVAEILLSSTGGYGVPEFSDRRSDDPRFVFAAFFNRLLQPMQTILDRRFRETIEYPRNEAELTRFLAQDGVDFAGARDPWGTPLAATGSYWRENHVLTISSAGPDKKNGTDDDIRVHQINRRWFQATGVALENAVAAYHQRTRGFVRDVATLEAELARAGVNWANLRDPWGHALQAGFDIDRNHFTITVQSAGPDGRLEPAVDYRNDDLNVWVTRQDYSASLREQVDQALVQHFIRTKHFPDAEPEVREAFAAARLTGDALRDPWGHAYTISFSTKYSYDDRVDIRIYDENGTTRVRGGTAPVTKVVRWVNLNSMGPDGLPDTPDDFQVVASSRTLAEHTGTAEIHPPVIASLAGQGAISGTVIDPSGAVIPGAKVIALMQGNTLRIAGATDAQGEFTLRNIPAGLYLLRVESEGFRSLLVQEVPVHAGAVTRVDARLEIGSISSVVTVEGSNVALETAHATISESRILALPILKLGVGSGSTANQLSTPRLREYFPETLLWLPELETDRSGRAEFAVPLADSITTWKMAAVASNLAGQIGFAEKEIRSFQPFFMEHEPPRVLTAGDEIALPVVLRNYLEKPLTLQLEMKPENWFTMLGPARKEAQVPAGDVSREIFQFRASAATRTGKQRVTAAGVAAGDAVEKPVHVHPDGEERMEMTTALLSQSGALHMRIPNEAIAGSLTAELKLYPNLAAHVIESIEGILQRPYGCGEQTISSTYPNLMFLRFARHTGARTPLLREAERNLRLGYQRLLGYRTEKGGFSYWGRGQADLALTSYALRFLHDAQGFVAVDENVLKGAREFVMHAASPDGRWFASGLGPSGSDRATNILTAYVARILAATAPKDGPDPARELLERALQNLAQRVEEWDEPHVLANFALAAQLTGKMKLAGQAASRLRTMARDERGGAYWTLESNTPFYGWGMPGRIETTALAVQVLAHPSERQQAGDAVQRGLIFLLNNKDRYGVWYSTQATINVLDALLLLAENAKDTPGSTAQVLVNGKPAATVVLPPSNVLTGPLLIDLSAFVEIGENQIAVRNAAQLAPTAAQLVATYYVPWGPNPETRVGGSRELKLGVAFDRTEASPGTAIKCKVSVERVGHRGYGMMVAEVGLPPGADVDRPSLERLVAGSEFAGNRYDVLPDRVILYVWPRAGGVNLEFTFRMRYGMRAKSAASILYDYYNPEARAAAPPALFAIHE